MRVTLVGPTAPLRGGIAAHTEGASLALGRRAHQVEVRGFSRLYPRWLGGHRPGSGREVKWDDHAIDALDPRSWRAVAAGISTDLLLVEYWTPLLAPALHTILTRAVARRKVLVCHNARPHERLGGSRLLLDSLLRRVDGVVLHSEAMRAALGRQTRSTLATAVVPMPLLLSPLGPASCPPELVAARGANEKLIVLAGHLRRYKGLSVLGRAWRSVNSAPGTRLVVAGEPIGSERELAALRTCADNVTVIARYIDDAELRWLLARAAAVVLPYTAASQSGLLPLALRLARHVIVSEVGGLDEQLACAGAAVSRVAAGDAGDLARAIGRALSGGPGVIFSALRQAKAEPAADEVAASWQPFVSAVERLGDMPIRQEPGSNTRAAAASVEGERSRDEAPRRAWYDAGPLVAAAAEIQRT